MDDDHAPLLGRGGHARTFRHRTHRSKTVTYLALSAVLITETFERIAFYGVVGSLVLFLNTSPFSWSSYNATNALFVFTGLSYMSSILGGWFADSCCGKFRTIIIAFCIYIAGYVFLPLLNLEIPLHRNITHPPDWCSWHEHKNVSNWSYNHQNDQMFTIQPAVQEDATNSVTMYPVSPIAGSIQSCSWTVYLSLITMGIGNGAVKANISPFGADQVLVTIVLFKT